MIPTSPTTSPTQLTFPKPPAVPPPYYSGGNGNGGKSSQTETVAAAGDVAALMNQSQLSGLMLGPPAAAKVPFLIGVAGGGASGKSQVCQSIMNSIQNVLETNKKLRVFTISMSDFYRQLTPDELSLAQRGLFDFDDPDAFDFDLLESVIDRLSLGMPVTLPSFDFKNHTRSTSAGICIADPDVVMIEGILILYSKKVRESLSLKVFVDVDDDDRLARHMVRNMELYSRPIDDILNHYVRFVKPSFEDFILPSKRYADVIIPRGHLNTIAVDLLSQHIKDILAERSQKSAGSSVEELSTGGVPISRSSSSTSSVGGAGTSGGGNVSITAGSTPKRDGATQRRMTDTKSPSMIGSDDHHLKMIRNIAK